MNIAEKKLAFKRPFDANNVNKAKSYAEKEVERAISNDIPIPADAGSYNNEVDAYRHCVWMQKSAELIGSSSRALDFGIAHEDFEGNPADEKAMDLHNNKVGANLKGLGAKACLNALFDGDLKHIKSDIAPDDLWRAKQDS